MVYGSRRYFSSMNAGALTRRAECRRNIEGYRPRSQSVAPISQIEGEKKNKRGERMEKKKRISIKILNK